jgi:hypothetical protein
VELDALKWSACIMHLPGAHKDMDHSTLLCTHCHTLATQLYGSMAFLLYMEMRCVTRARPTAKQSEVGDKGEAMARDRIALQKACVLPQVMCVHFKRFSTSADIAGVRRSFLPTYWTPQTMTTRT